MRKNWYFCLATLNAATLVNSIFQECGFVRKILRKPPERSEIELSESLLVEIRVSVPQKVTAVLKLGGENLVLGVEFWRFSVKFLERLRAF